MMHLKIPIGARVVHVGCKEKDPITYIVTSGIVEFTKAYTEVGYRVRQMNHDGSAGDGRMWFAEWELKEVD